LPRQNCASRLDYGMYGRGKDVIQRYRAHISGPVDCENDVAMPDAGSFGSAAGGHVVDEEPRGFRLHHAKTARDISRDVLTLNGEPAPPQAEGGKNRSIERVMKFLERPIRSPIGIELQCHPVSCAQPQGFENVECFGVLSGKVVEAGLGHVVSDLLGASSLRVNGFAQPRERREGVARRQPRDQFLEVASEYNLVEQKFVNDTF
jgi:hypothetical protein